MIKTIASPIVSASNNIVRFSKGTKKLPAVQKDLVNFNKFLEIKTIELERIKLPEKKKIKQLANLNIASTFGSAGGLLSQLASGALDVAGFLGNFFPSKGKIGKPQRTKGLKPPKPKISGPKLRIGGLRAIGVANALFTGLDFATGLQEGESVGKAAAGAGGSLAGSLLGGAIGQALIPIPGVGFIIGSAVGGMLGGYTADRVYEGGESLSKKLKGKLKGQEKNQKALAAPSNDFSSIINKFSSSMSKFEGFVSGMSVTSAGNQTSGKTEEGKELEYGEPEPKLEPRQKTDQILQDVEAQGGRKPSSSIITSKYGLRWGRQHYGTDYGEKEGTPVSVIQPGTVAFSGYSGSGGNTVHIDHPDGSQTRYLHLQKTPNVKTGQKVEPGTVIGYVGTTGRSTAEHLHFEYAPPGQGSINSAPYADKYFRFGGNVKVKEKAKEQAKGGQSNIFNLELHSDANTTGLIASYIDPKTGMSNSLSSKFGAYDRNFRGGDLGAAKRGLNIIETNQKVGIEANAQKIIESIAANKGQQVNIFAGHNDVTKGETGMSGEQEYTRKLAERIEQLAKQMGLTNVKYYRSIIANDPNDPNANWNRAFSMRNQGATPSPASPAAPPAAPAAAVKNLQSTQNIQSYPSYNKAQSSITVMPIMMGSSGENTQQQKPVFIPVGGGGGGTVVLPGPSEGQLVNSLIKMMLLTNLSGA